MEHKTQLGMPPNPLNGIEQINPLPFPELLKELRNTTMLLQNLHNNMRNTPSGKQMNIADRARTMHNLRVQKNALAQAALMLANSAVIEAQFLDLIKALAPIMKSINNDARLLPAIIGKVAVDMSIDDIANLRKAVGEQ